MFIGTIARSPCGGQRLAARLQQRPHAARGDRQRDVVDGAPERVLDRVHVRELHAHDLEAPARADRLVEARVGGAVELVARRSRSSAARAVQSASRGMQHAVDAHLRGWADRFAGEQPLPRAREPGQGAAGRPRLRRGLGRAAAGLLVCRRARDPLPGARRAGSGWARGSSRASGARRRPSRRRPPCSGGSWWRAPSRRPRGPRRSPSPTAGGGGRGAARRSPRPTPQLPLPAGGGQRRARDVARRARRSGSSCHSGHDSPPVWGSESRWE